MTGSYDVLWADPGLNLDLSHGRLFENEKIMFEIKVDINQLKRFILSGGGATFCHLALMTLLVWGGINATLSTSIGVVAGAVANYILQYHYTFKANIKHKKSILNYLITVSFSFLSNLLLFMFFHDFLQSGVILSQILTSSIVALQNYLIYKKFVFLMVREDL